MKHKKARHKEQQFLIINTFLYYPEQIKSSTLYHQEEEYCYLSNYRATVEFTKWSNIVLSSPNNT
jgi:hypothetical protein